MTILMQDLQKIFPGGKVVLSGINLEVGGTFGLLGPNGAGKTTLMRILATLMEPTSGSVTVDGIPLTTRAEVRRRLGYLPQKFGFYPQFTVYESMAFMAGLAQVEANRARLMDLLALVGLADRAGARVRHLSGGMVQRLGIATALLGDPRVLIVDEPTAGLDHDSRLSFRNLLAGLAADRTVLLSTHIVSDVATTCSRLAVLQAGQVIFTGTPAALASMADGQVWESVVPAAAWSRFERQYRPVAALRESSTVRARVVASAPPTDYESTAVASTLEDGYVWVLRQGGDVA